MDISSPRKICLTPSTMGGIRSYTLPQRTTLGAIKDHSLNSDELRRAAETYLWIKNSPALTQAEHDFARTCLLLLDSKLEYPREYGAMNRSMGSAEARMLISLLFPDDGYNQ